MSGVRRALTLIARNEFWLIGIYGVPLLLSSSLPLWVLALALATVPVFWIARRAAYGHWSVRTPLDLPIVLLLTMGVVGVAVSLDRAVSTRAYAELLGGAALYYGVVNGLRAPGVANAPTNASAPDGARRHFELALWLLIALAAAMGAVGWLGLRYSDKFLPVPELLTFLPRLDLNFVNPRGFTPNIVAGALAPVVPLCWAVAFTRDLKARALLLAVSAFLLGVIVLTQSRGALLGIALALAILLVWRRRGLMWLVPVLALVIAALLLFARPANLADALLVSDSTGTAAGRLELWSRALYMLIDFPYTGIGVGTFQEVVLALYPVLLNPPDFPLPHAHNLYLQMGVDYGIPGLVAFAGLVTTTLGSGLKAWRREGQTSGGWRAAGLVTGYIVYLTHGLLDAVGVSTKVSVVVWFLLGLLMVLYLRDE